MSVSNTAIARLFARAADLLELSGANPFRVRAYRAAVRRIENLPDALHDMLAAGQDLTTLDGIGVDLAGAIREICEEGGFSLVEELQAAIPPGVVEFLAVEGLGPKKARRLWLELGVQDIDGLAAAAEAGRVRDLAGFGARSEENLAAAIARYRARSGRKLRPDAERRANALRDRLAARPEVQEVAIAGSLRRQRETIGDLDLLVAADPADAGAIMEAFASAPGVEAVIARGDTKTSVRLEGDLQADLRVVDPSVFGAALHYFTGSRDHNIEIRRRAQARGLRVNEYGIFDGDGHSRGGRVESEIFEALGLPWIPPELREGRGECEAAEQGTMPGLITTADIRGNLHTHSDWSDGTRSLREMAEEARRRGYEYLAFTDHSFGLRVANGLDGERLRRQIDDIAALDAEFDDITLLSGIECEITPEGDLELETDVLSRLDVVIGAIHSRFGLPEAAQTERLLRALENPYLHFVAHPTGRLLTRRDGYAIDLERVLRSGAERGVAFEINANPWRLDLDDRWARMARDLGLPVPINTDAHGFEDFDNLGCGIAQARRAWLTADDVPTAWPLARLRTWLRSRRPA